MSTASIKAHFLRAIYEGVAFSHLYHTERLRNINPKLSHTIRIAGGVTNSPVWLQIFADIFRATLEIVDVKEHGTLGTAMTAAVMVGWFAEVFAASNDMVHVSRTVSLIRKTTGSTRPNTSFIKPVIRNAVAVEKLQ